MEKKNSPIMLLLRIAQPLLLIEGLFTYVLGLGIVHYLGLSLNWLNAFLGSILVLALVLSRNFLNAFFEHPRAITSPGIFRNISEEEPDFINLKEISRQMLLQISMVTLSMGAVVTTLLIFRGSINFPMLLTLGVSLLLIFFEVFPKTKLNRKGYGELIESVLVANLIPTLAFLLQKPEVHILLAMLTIPLTLLMLASKIALSLEYYSYDLNHQSGSMLVRLGWQRGMVIHNLSVLFAFLLVGVFLVFGLSWTLAWPIFLALPLGGFQIFQMGKIAEGAKPHWALLRVNAIGTLIIVIYLISFTLWVH